MANYYYYNNKLDKIEIKKIENFDQDWYERIILPAIDAPLLKFKESISSVHKDKIAHEEADFERCLLRVITDKDIEFTKKNMLYMKVAAYAYSTEDYHFLIKEFWDGYHNSVYTIHSIGIVILGKYFLPKNMAIDYLHEIKEEVF